MIFAACPLGVFGVDRFLLGDTGLGIVKMLTFGQFLIGFTIDIFTVKKRTRDYNFDLFLKFKIKSIIY
jgi:TM2 domain-containing membrane protein YozV